MRRQIVVDLLWFRRRRLVPPVRSPVLDRIPPRHLVGVIGLLIMVVLTVIAKVTHQPWLDSFPGSTGFRYMSGYVELHTPPVDYYPPTARTMKNIENIDGRYCRGAGEYADVVEGVPLIVSDETGKVLAGNHLDQGLLLENTCSSPFETIRVPKGHPFYLVRVASHGPVRVQPSELDDVRLSIGS